MNTNGHSNIITDLKLNYVRSTARHTIQLQFDISANTLEIRTEQSSKGIV
jgi:hypothetical protein